MFNRNNAVVSNALAFGCSHTFGTGVEPNETWSYLLNARNYGVPGCSADFVARTAPAIIEELSPDVVYVLWPDWTRFEIIKNGIITQSLPMDKDRINYVESHNETWLKNNFQQQTTSLRSFCKEKNIRLIDMTLYDLILHIDHADRWPLSKLGHHYSPVWHQWVADIFKTTNEHQELAYE